VLETLRRIFGICGVGRFAKSRYILVVGVLMVAGFLFAAGVVEAHAGGKMQIASEDAGPFKLTVWTSPDPATAGEVHVAAAVASAEDALPILDAALFIEMIPQNGQGEILSGQATTEDSVNRFLYETIFDVPEVGLYLVSVTATGADGQQGAVSFELEVQEAPPLIFGLAALVVLAVVTGGAVYFYLRWSSPQPVLEEADASDAVAD
jgi:hypothetical protein